MITIKLTAKTEKGTEGLKKMFSEKLSIAHIKQANKRLESEVPFSFSFMPNQFKHFQAKGSLKSTIYAGTLAICQEYELVEDDIIIEVI